MFTPLKHPHTTAIRAASPTAQEVLDFWLGDGLHFDWPSTDHNPLWFGGSKAQDEKIAQHFGALVDTALAGDLIDWEDHLHSRLALVIVLDQFTRNVYRGQAKAFSGDNRAQALVRQTLAQGDDAQLSRVGRVFLYMPLMHAEDLDLQDTCVARFNDLVNNAPEALKETLSNNLRFAISHREIVAHFGRFPYRNAALGRTNTAEEDEFLVSGPRFGQWHNMTHPNKCRTLVIHAHPGPSRSIVTQALCRVLASTDNTSLRSLYELYPDFDIDVPAEQAALQAADLVVWLTPVHWYSVPALMKHWFDQVLSFGWAYGHGAQALRGKPVWWVTSAGGAEADYAPDHPHLRPFNELAVPAIEHVARYCHMSWLPPFVVYGGHSNTADDLARHSQSLALDFEHHRQASALARYGAIA